MGVLGDSGATGPSSDAESESSNQPGVPASPARQWIPAVAALIVTLAIVLPPLFAWQSENQQKALSLSNMRRVAVGCLVYAEDWDERTPPPVQRMPNGFVLSWPRLVRPYVLLDDAFSNPSNPVKPFQSRSVLVDPVDNRAIETSYALNRRFWSQFAPGPFPLDNLEMPEQTALIVEAGRMAANPRRPWLIVPSGPGYAMDQYGDTLDRFNGLSPYPSTHGGQYGVVAADGHGQMGRVLYYSSEDGPHDKTLGRIANGVYDWNGGHANGRTDEPARE